jgi:phosphomevalonate kinase
MLGEVDTGSSTPSMVSKVLSWKKDNPVECLLISSALLCLASKLWTKLNSMNTEIINLFQKLKKLDTTDGYDQKIDELSRFHHSKVRLNRWCA